MPLRSLARSLASRFAMPAALALLAALALPATLSAEMVHSVALYGWGTFVDGKVLVNNREPGVGVDVNAAQVIDAIEMGLMARYRGQAEHFAIVFDGIYASLGGQNDGTPHTEADFNMYIFQLDAAYRFSENVEILGGARYVQFESTLDIGEAHREGDVSLLDPIIGFRTTTGLGQRMLFQSQFDIGGGANMDLTWQAMIHLGWKLGSTGKSSLWLGYRALDMDFDNSGNHNGLSADMTLHGPVIGAAFSL